MYLELYRITAELVAKTLLPAVLVFIVLTFRPTVASVLSRTTDLEIAGAKLKFADRLAETVSQAIKSGGTMKIEAVVHNLQKEAAGDVIRAFWKPDGHNVSRSNEQVLRNWIAANGLGESITWFVFAENMEDAREKAVRELGLAK